MRIGNVDLGEKPLLLAPMEDVTDIGFRLLCRRMGAAMVYSEFVSCDALVRMVNRSLEKLAVCPEERPVAVQIYGKDSEAMAQAARIVVEQAHPDVLDINFGCPVKKVAGKGAGSGMLRDVPQLLAVTRAVVDAVPDTPVTVKTRLGWDEQSLYLPDGTPFIVDLALRLQDCGVQALTLHGRTRAQMYTGEADWTLIGQVKNHPDMHISVIGNGDITSAQEAQQAQQAPVTTEPVVTPLETAPATQTTVTDVDNAVVRQESVSLIAGSGLQNFSVVVGSFGVKANAEGLYNTLKSAGYDAQIVQGERNMYRVVATTFADKANAVKSRNELRAGKYPDAWLLFKK